MNMRYLLASATLATALIGASAVYADSDRSGPDRGDRGLHLGSFIGLHLGDKHDADVEDRNDVDIDDDDATTSVKEERGEAHKHKIEVKEDFLARFNNFTAGIVSSINGSTFTINPFRQEGTTTVTTSASTTFKVNGQATTSSALNVGSRVFITGSTTSTTTPTFAAEIVNIFTRGFGFLRHLFSD